MADSILNIVIRARDETQAAFQVIQQQLKTIENSVKGLDGSNVKGASEEFNKLGASSKQAAEGINTVSKAAKSTAVDMEGLYGILRRVSGVFAGFFTVGFIKSLADGAARTEVLGTVLTQVAQNAGITAEYIAKVDKQVQALGITAESSRQSLSQFVQSGLDITKAAELARAAQDLAVISGRDSSATFAHLITSIQQMNTVSLRFMGIIVDVEQATNRYAAANDLAASSISRATKQQILLDEVLQQSEKLQGLYEASMTNVGKQLTSLARYQKEAADSAGELLLPAYSVLVREFTLFLKQIGLITEGWQAASQANVTLANSIQPIVSGLREMAVFVVKNAVALAELAATIYIVVRANAILTSSLIFLAGGMSRLLLGIQYVAAAWRGLMILFAASPVGVIVGGLALIGTAAVAMYNAFKKNDDAKGAMEELKDNYAALNDLSVKQAKLEGERNDARLGRGTKTAAQATEELKLVKDQVKEIEKRNLELEKSLSLSKAGVAEVKAEADALAAQSAAMKETQKQIDDVTDKLTKLGVAGSSARKGLDISAGFDEKKGAFVAAVEAYRASLKNLDGSAVVTEGQVNLAALALADAAKTTDELRAALELLGNSGSVSTAKLAGKLKELELKEAKTGIEQATRALATFVERSQQAGETLGTLNSVQDAVRESSTRLATEMLKVGAATDAQGADIDALTGKLKVNAQTQQALGEAERQALRDTAETASRRYQSEIAQINSTKAARLAAASNLAGETRAANAAVASAETEAATKSIAAAKTKFDSLIKLQQEYLRRAVETAEAVKAIDEAIFQSKKTLEEKLFNLNLKGKTEEQQQAILLEAIQKRAADAEAARLQGNFDLAKRLNEERIAFVDRLAVPENASEQQKAAVAAQLTDAYKQQTDILTAQKRIKETARDEEIAGYKDVTKQLQTISAELLKFAGEQVMKLSVQLDTGSLNTLVQQIQDAVSNITVSLKITAERPAGFATGGLVTGPGTSRSDSILARLSNNEFVMNADAVSHYGVRFMDMLNRMALPAIPRFATGGLVTAPATSGGGGGSRDVVDVNLNLGGQKVSLMGERTQVRRLVSSLKNLQGV